nr:uncharacterized protein LOC114821132 [Malus domestica]
MPHLFQEVICSMKCAPTQCSPNAVRAMMGFSNLSKFFDLGLTIHELCYFFEIGHKEGVGQLRSHHRLLDASSKGDYEWVRDTFEVSEEWESDYSPELHVLTTFINHSEFGSTLRTSPVMKKVHVALSIPAEYCEWSGCSAVFVGRKVACLRRKR